MEIVSLLLVNVDSTMNATFRQLTNKDTYFKKHVRFAQSVGLPLYLHCRGDGAFEHMKIILDDCGYNGRAFVHCFTGGKDEAVEWISRGFYIGITGWISSRNKHRNGDLNDAMRSGAIPLNKVLVETDAPFLSCNNHRDSHPIQTGKLIDILAKIYKRDYDAVGRQIYMNSMSFLWKNGMEE